MSEYTIEDLRPTEVEAYLKSRDWSRLRNVANGAVWVLEGRTGETQADVFVPHAVEFGDYGRRLDDLVETVSSLEQRSVSELIRDLVETSADVVRFRLQYTFLDESVRLADALTLFQRARQALRAAALSAVEPRAVHSPGAAPHQVDAFLSELRLGHSERGSYVVPVIAPLGSVEGPAGELGPRVDAPFARSATVELASALSAIVEALPTAKTDNDLRLFAAAVPVGVSADLCNAISELAQAGRRPADEAVPADDPTAMTIRISWSPARPLIKPIASAFSLLTDDIPILQDAARFLKASVPRPRVRITGQVVRLERQEDEPEGSIGIKGKTDDDEERMVVVKLPPTDYAQALRAHDLRLPVTCTGVLERRGTHLVFVEPIEFGAPEGLF